MTRPPFRWLIVTDAAVADEARTIAVVDRMAAEFGGQRVAVGLRDHAMGTRARLAFGGALRDATRASGATLLVFDRIDLARLVDADGVHLGERSVSVDDARALLPRVRWIGRSCHDLAGLRSAQAASASYATLSPVFPSPGKGSPIGVARSVAWIEACAELAVFALGGIDAASLADAFATGAHGVALIRGALGEGEVDRLIAAARAVGPAILDR